MISVLPSNSSTLCEVRDTSKSNFLTSAQVLQEFGKKLSLHEKTEILNYEKVYYAGQRCLEKINAPVRGRANNGYDNDGGYYTIIPNDHIAYRYEVVGRLGEGAFGQVIKVIDHARDIVVALKLIRNRRSDAKQAETEVELLRHVNKADPDDKYGIVQLFDSFRFRNHVCITFEILGMNLYEYMERTNFHPLSLSMIRKITARLLVALAFLSKENIVHSDLKPENILFKSNEDTRVKLVDFGSACYDSQSTYCYIQSRFYRAPEIILNMPFGRAIDMWSFGCILCELATGYPLFPGENEHDQLTHIMEYFGPPSKEIIQACMKKHTYFDADQNPILVPNSKIKDRKLNSKILADFLRLAPDHDFVNFIEQILRWNPKERLTPRDAMKHPWVSEEFVLRTSPSTGTNQVKLTPQVLDSAELNPKINTLTKESPETKATEVSPKINTLTKESPETKATEVSPKINTLTKESPETKATEVSPKINTLTKESPETKATEVSPKINTLTKESPETKATEVSLRAPKMMKADTIQKDSVGMIKCAPLKNTQKLLVLNHAHMNRSRDTYSGILPPNLSLAELDVLLTPEAVPVVPASVKPMVLMDLKPLQPVSDLGRKISDPSAPEHLQLGDTATVDQLDVYPSEQTHFMSKSFLGYSHLHDMPKNFNSLPGSDGNTGRGTTISAGGGVTSCVNGATHDKIKKSPLEKQLGDPSVLQLPSLRTQQMSKGLLHTPTTPSCCSVSSNNNRSPSNLFLSQCYPSALDSPINLLQDTHHTKCGVASVLRVLPPRFNVMTPKRRRYLTALRQERKDIPRMLSRPPLVGGGEPAKID